MNPNLEKTLSIVKQCYDTLDDKKAIDIKILKLAGKSNITDYFIIATGTSDPHLRALRNALEKNLDELKLKHIKINYKPESGWVVIDGFDFIIHLFLGETREFYGLENLWKDAEIIDINQIPPSNNPKT